LFDKLSHLGKTLLMETLPSILDGTAKRIVQEETAVTFAYNLKKAEEHLNLNQDKRSVYNQYRAFLEEPACYVLIDHQRLKIYQLSLVESALKKEDNTLENGTITHIAKRYIRVKVKDGYIDIFEVQLAGKSKQPIVLFMNGAGRKLINLRKVLQ
jgi:methionyl-tRNA formyltransferase